MTHTHHYSNTLDPRSIVAQIARSGGFSELPKAETWMDGLMREIEAAHSAIDTPQPHELEEWV